MKNLRAVVPEEMLGTKRKGSSWSTLFSYESWGRSMYFDPGKWLLGDIASRNTGKNLSLRSKWIPAGYRLSSLSDLFHNLRFLFLVVFFGRNCPPWQTRDSHLRFISRVWWVRVTRVVPAGFVHGDVFARTFHFLRGISAVGWSVRVFYPTDHRPNI